MTDDGRGYLVKQFDTACALANFHLASLTTEECLWRPAARGLHVRQSADGHWRADWPEHEGYDLGPPSIGWLTWHIGFWWSMVLDHSYGKATLSRETIFWPGTADDARRRLTELETAWRTRLTALTPDELQRTDRTRWPFRNRPFGDVAAWVNLELTKNAAEIGYARFLYATSTNH
jgi:DinB superfamily